jgi:hypothetical protein
MTTYVHEPFFAPPSRVAVKRLGKVATGASSLVVALTTPRMQVLASPVAETLVRTLTSQGSPYLRPRRTLDSQSVTAALLEGHPNASTSV